MSRIPRVPGLLALALATACSSSSKKAPDQVAIALFQAAPDTIEVGQSTTLLFAVTPADATLTLAGVGNVTGQTRTTVSPTATTAYQLTATKGTATTQGTVTVTVGPRHAVALRLTPSTGAPTAGQAFDVTVAAVDATGATATGFRGTLHLSSSDPAAVLPADFTLGAAEAGVRQVAVTLKTADLATLAAADTSPTGVAGTTTVSVGPASASSCAIGQAPASAVAGAGLDLVVALRDPYGNPATGYGGTVAIGSSDPRASLPLPYAFLPVLDAGSHAFPAVLLTAGTQTLTASDTLDPTIHCGASIVVTHAAPRIALAMPSSANAGFPVAVGATVLDLFDNLVADFAGTVSFTSTDGGAGALVPAPIVFTGSEGGVGGTSATFVTPGRQTIGASDGATASGSASTTVQGLSYANPTTGRVRLVLNAAQSSAGVVQLDLVANERLEISTFFGGGPGSFTAGMNLPLDTTRVGPDATLFTPGPALPPGAGLRAAAAAIGATDHVLYTAVARKRAAGTVFTQVTEVQRGQAFYSVRLALAPTATAGPVFDGAQPSPLYRAAVRDQWGNDFVGQDDIGVGRLEVR